MNDGPCFAACTEVGRVLQQLNNILCMQKRAAWQDKQLLYCIHILFISDMHDSNIIHVIFYIQNLMFINTKYMYSSIIIKVASLELYLAQVLV